MEFRLILGTNPKEKIQNVKSLFPDDKILEDEENLDYSTELVKIKATRVSDGFLAYLRSVLMLNNYEGEDKKYINVSSPVVIDFELLVLDFAVNLLTEWANLPANKEFYLNSTLAQDTAKLNDMKEAATDKNGILVLEYNIQLKRTLQLAIKMMKVLREILK